MKGIQNQKNPSAEGNQATANSDQILNLDEIKPLKSTREN